ncbi:unnamed protein product [Fraxinus pennsylvanica]|uniref:BRISC and BRCA1-A complex member 1 n=1 Tax=Fraxinus pennsylvanica TaxID=56036 RepID=A0AAD1YQK4_9LAMI|nr:unnamed protein product [Fraxinus pennsylvanica]
MEGRGTEGRSSPAQLGNPPSLPGPGAVGYTLPPARFFNEDILFCIDVGPETMVEMKVAAGPNGRPFTRLESIKQAILLFINAKLTINPDHRFAFAALTKTFSWLRKEFSSEVDSATAALQGISVDSSSSHADLTQLLRVAAHEAKKSRAQSRIFRVILLYCRSSVSPQYKLPTTQKLFTLDVVYLHDKPGPDNCPQKVYDTLVEALEHLLSHPQQRCVQDDFDVPKTLTKRSPPAESAPVDENAIVSIQ